MPAGEDPQRSLPYHDGHEQRLQRLEAGQQAMTGALASVTAKVESLDAKVEASTGRIMDHIDAVIAPQQQRLNDHIAADGVVAARVEMVEKDVQAQGSRVAAVEAAEHRRAERREFWKKLVIPVAAGLITLGLRELVGWGLHAYHG